MTLHSIIAVLQLAVSIAEAAAGTAAHSGSQRGRIVREVVGQWRADIAGAFYMTYQVDLFMKADGTYECRMTKLDGREPVWTGATRGRYSVEKALAARVEYASAWMLKFEPDAAASISPDAVRVMQVYGLPIDRAVSVRMEFSPANLGGNFGGPTLNYDGEPGSTGFGMRYMPAR